MLRLEWTVVIDKQAARIFFFYVCFLKNNIEMLLDLLWTIQRIHYYSALAADIMRQLSSRTYKHDIGNHGYCN